MHVDQEHYEEDNIEIPKPATPFAVKLTDDQNRRHHVSRKKKKIGKRSVEMTMTIS